MLCQKLSLSCVTSNLIYMSVCATIVLYYETELIT